MSQLSYQIEAVYTEADKVRTLLELGTSIKDAVEGLVSQLAAEKLFDGSLVEK